MILKSRLFSNTSHPLPIRKRRSTSLIKTEKDCSERENDFEAHEVLEFQWKKDSGIRKIFLQGIIQLSVSLHKIYGKPNGRGSRMQAERSKEKLEAVFRSGGLSEKGRRTIFDLLQSLDQIINLYEGDELLVEKVSAFCIPSLPKEWRELFRG